VAQLEAGEKSNPSTVINNAYAQEAARKNMGVELQKAAAVKLQQADNPNGIGYQNKAADLASMTDPRGFAFAAGGYTKQQAADLVKTMSPAQKAKFLKGAGIGHRLNMVGATPE
jgi:hypothetical protein